MRAVCVSLSVALLSPVALAADELSLPTPETPPAAPETISFGYSPYERETIKLVTSKLKAEVDPAPEGKTIEAFASERLEVFERRDFLPRFLLWVNALHATTKGYIIEREALQGAGDPYHQLAMDETARNLRSLPQLSLVLIVPLKGSAPDRVRVLIVTKDVWSLRLQWNIALTPGGLENLVLQPAETNLGGIHHTLGATMVYQPLSTSIGTQYSIPRLLGSRVALSASLNGIVNNGSGGLEGSYGVLSVGQPLWSTKTEWAWAVSAQWRDEITRRYSQAQLALYQSPSIPKSERGIPDEYRSERVQAEAAVTRSFGWALKNDFTLSLEASYARYRTDDLSGTDPVAVKDFVTNRMPVSDDRYYPALEWRSYTTSFLSVLDLETLGLQEDYRTGHFLDVKAYPVSQNLGSTRTFFGLFAEAGYTLPIRDGMLRVDVQTTTEANTDEVLQGSITGNAYLASPRTPIGRIVWSGFVLDRYANYLNVTTTIGGNNRLRGYPTSYFFGKDAIASNLEYRSRGLEILKVQLGGVLFYDVGDAFNGFLNLHPQHTVGVGLRALFPQFDRIVFRADLGVPISRSPLPDDVSPVSFYVTFSQAFSPVTFGSPTQSVGLLTPR